MNKNLKSYEVNLLDDYGNFLFLCEAEDDEHAEEQALNAYPGAQISDIDCVDDWTL